MSSISPCEGDGPGANPGFLTKSFVSDRQIISDFDPVRSKSGSLPETSCIKLVQSRFESALGS